MVPPPDTGSSSLSSSSSSTRPSSSAALSPSSFSRQSVQERQDTRRREDEQERKGEKHSSSPSHERKEEEERKRRTSRGGGEEDSPNQQRRQKIGKRLLEKLHVLPVYESKAADDQVFSTLKKMMKEEILFHQHMSFEVSSSSSTKKEIEEEEKKKKNTSPPLPSDKPPHPHLYPSTTHTPPLTSSSTCTYIVVECIPPSGYLDQNTLVFLKGQPLKPLRRVQLLALVHPNSSYGRRAGIDSFQQLFNQSRDFPSHVDRINPLVSFTSSSSSSSSSFFYMFSPFSVDAHQVPRRDREGQEEEDEEEGENRQDDSSSSSTASNRSHPRAEGEEERRREEEEEDFFDHLERLQDEYTHRLPPSSRRENGGAQQGRHRPFSLLADYFTRQDELRRRRKKKKQRGGDREGEEEDEDDRKKSQEKNDNFCPFTSASETSSEGTGSEREEEERREKEDAEKDQGGGEEKRRVSHVVLSRRHTDGDGDEASLKDSSILLPLRPPQSRPHSASSLPGPCTLQKRRVSRFVSPSSSSSLSHTPGEVRSSSPSQSPHEKEEEEERRRHQGGGQEEEKKKEEEEERDKKRAEDSRTSPSSSRSSTSLPSIPQEREEEEGGGKEKPQQEGEKIQSDISMERDNSLPPSHDRHLLHDNNHANVSSSSSSSPFYRRCPHTTTESLTSRHGYQSENLLLKMRKKITLQSVVPSRRLPGLQHDRQRARKGLPPERDEEEHQGERTLRLRRERALKEMTPENLFHAYIGPYLVSRMYGSAKESGLSSSSSSEERESAADGENLRTNDHSAKEEEETKKKKKKKKKKKDRRSFTSKKSSSVMVLYPGKKIVIGNLTFVVWATDPHSLPGFLDPNTCIYISLDPYGEFYRVHFVPFSDTLPTTYIFDFYEDYLKPFLLENKWRIFRRGDVYTYRGVEFKLIASEPESCLYARVGPETIVHHQGSVLPTILDILPRDVLARIRRLPTRLQPYAIIAAAQRLDPQALLRVIPSSAFHSSSRGINDRVVDLLQENLVRPFNFKFYLRNFPEMCELKRKTSSSSETAQLRASSPSSSSGSTSLEKRKTTEEEEEGDMLEKKKKIGDGGRPEEEEERNDGILRRGSDTREKNEEEEERDKREEMMGTGERRRDSYAGNHGMKEKGKLPKEQKREEEKIKKDLPAKNSKTKMERGGASSSRDERPMKPSPGVDRRVLEGQEDREEEEEEAKEELLLSSYERPACTVCTLCIEERDLSIILPCGHVFHWQCVHAWLRRNSTCPNCRADINVLIQKAQAQQGGGGGGGGFLQRFSSSASSLLQQGRNSGENTHEREGLRNTQTLSSSTSRNTGRLREGREEEGHEERRRSDGERENRERASRGASEEIRDGSRTNRSDTFSFLRCFFSDFL